ncbi:hypothetical protein DPMN_168559 [Dreissena polymorpha]|uniref:Uncharacterized protein n=1 Tax=Dreissena polymorpha TaxID=45954 RepID=A0A9D4F5D0_DREPO|nr:hypothetical protein DPMN_168559 [Dreissena polymorpha]
MNEEVRNLKVGKYPGVDNVPTKLIKHGGEAATAASTVLNQRSGRSRSGLRSGSSHWSYP